MPRQIDLGCIKLKLFADGVSAISQRKFFPKIEMASKCNAPGGDKIPEIYKSSFWKFLKTKHLHWIHPYWIGSTHSHNIYISVYSISWTILITITNCRYLVFLVCIIKHATMKNHHFLLTNWLRCGCFLGATQVWYLGLRCGWCLGWPGWLGWDQLDEWCAGVV